MKLDDAKLQRIQLELKVLDLRLQVAEAEVARFDVRRAWADAEFHEEDHPRAADGKFATVVGPSAVAGVEDYQKSLGGKKGNVAGLIRHLLMRGDVPEDQIFNAAVEHYGLGADKTHYVKWYHAELRKKGLAPPPLLQGEKLKKGPKIEKIEGPPPPPAHMPPPPPTSAPPPAPPSVDQLTKMTNREFFTTYGVGVFNKLDPGATRFVGVLLPCYGQRDRGRALRCGLPPQGASRGAEKPP